MEQTRINELNKKIIKSFEDFREELNKNIEVLKSVIKDSTIELEDSLQEEIKEALRQLSNVKNSISRKITIMKKKNDEGKPLFIKDKRYNPIMGDSRYEGKFLKGQEKIDSLDEKINKYQECANKITSTTGIKMTFENRIKKLSAKKGTIENNQNKIVDKAIKEKMRQYQNKIKSVNRMSSAITSFDDKNRLEIEKLNSLKKDYEEAKVFGNILFDSNNLVDKALGVKIKFKSLLNVPKINALKVKSGIIDLKNSHVIKKGIKSSIIDKMKEKARIFGEAVKVGVNTFYETFNEMSEQSKTR